MKRQKDISTFPEGLIVRCINGIVRFVTKSREGYFEDNGLVSGQTPSTNCRNHHYRLIGKPIKSKSKPFAIFPNDKIEIGMIASVIVHNLFDEIVEHSNFSHGDKHAYLQTSQIAVKFHAKYKHVEDWKTAIGLSGEDTVGQAERKIADGAVGDFIDCNSWEECIIQFAKKELKK